MAKSQNAEGRRSLSAPSASTGGQPEASFCSGGRLKPLAVGAIVVGLALLALLVLGIYDAETQDFMVHYHVRRGDGGGGGGGDLAPLDSRNSGVVDTSSAVGDTSGKMPVPGTFPGTAAAASNFSDPMSLLRQWNTTRHLPSCSVDLSALVPRRLPRHPQGRCFVSDKYKLIYILVPKAGSSTSRAICERYGMRKTVLSQLTLEQRQYFTFGFWRDPLSRLPSAFGTLLSRARGGPDCSDILKFAGHTVDERERLCKDMYADTYGFHKFVGDLDQFAGVEFDEHVRPQTTFFGEDPGGEPVRLDFLANVEHASDSWVAISKLKGFDPPLDMSTFMRNQKEGGYWLKKLQTNLSHTPSTAAAVRRLYRQDYCCFGLERPDSEACK